ncbi:Phage integrase family protein [Humidesulfovibrio mexicanus]|uniref:Phage integrase family protein n=2 Tax=Humidesulfovibrio mexicanus TaxID=147047 RepID=A0A239B7X4_9BACT|nr:Phage integrase family protein [Humidesulfovibrio mexicanus]
MNTMPKCPGVHRRPGTSNWHYTRRVPLDLVQHYGRKFLTHSLGTSIHREACDKARAEAHRLDQEFAQVRERLAAGAAAQPTPQLTQDKAQALALRWLHSALAGAEDFRSLATSPTTEEALEAREETLAHLESDAAERLALNDYGMALQEAKELLKAEGLDMVAHPLDYSLLARELLKARITFLRQEQRRTWGDYSEPVPPLPAKPALSRSPAPPDGGLTLSGLFDKWVEEKQRSKPEATLKDFGVYVRRFIELHGDLPLTSITKAHVRDFKAAMLKLPSVIRLPHKYRGLTVPELLELAENHPELERLSPLTVNNKVLGAVGAVMNWGEKNGYMETNPAAGIKVDGSKSQPKTRVPYSTDDLNLIFRFPVYTKCQRPKAGGGEAAKWLPILALFTGARLQELGRLRVEDVREEWGVLFFDLTTAGTKTKSAKRNVPIHPELVRLGFLDYLEERRKAGGGPLFPALKSAQDSPTESWSKWWGRYARDNGITDPRKVFHSFRHTVKDGFRNSRVAKEYRDLIQGHAIPGVGEEYGSGTGLQVLAEEMAKLRFPGLDLEHLVPRP